MKTIWTESVSIPKRNHLPGNLSTDVAVIGGGMAGILTAHYLSQAGRQVIVLEADRIGLGQTAGTTAKITSQHNLIYDRLIKTMGKKKAGLYAAANQQAIAEFRHLIKSRSIFCDLEFCSSCLYSLEREDLLQREWKAAREVGIQAEFQKNTELPFSVKGALYYPEQAHFHPRKFLAALSYPLTIFEQTPVYTVKPSGGHQVLYTAHGKVTAKDVVFACHYPFPIIPGFYFAKMYQQRSYVLALSNVPVIQNMYLGVDAGKLSFRPCKDILLLGGQGHRTGKPVPGNKIYDDHYDALADTASHLYPHSAVCGHWSAQDCITIDHVPYIGRFSARNPHWYVATGFQKWGMTSSMVSALLLTDLICGHSSPFEDLFAPNRFTFRASAAELGTHLLESTKGLTAGAFCRTPKCPHMGCKLVWNPTDKAWECPCHGSRFDQCGHLESGPAQTDMLGHNL